MVTSGGGYAGTKTVLFNLYGKSTDEKPIGTYDGIEIANGSSYFEIDTQSIVFYDADTGTWV